MNFILIIGVIFLFDLGNVHLTCFHSYHNCGQTVSLDCIPNEWVCDHHEDCKDGSDEAHCPIVKCEYDQHRCTNSDRCIKIQQLCDGINDCEDNSDESNCNLCNELKEYDCSNALKLECIKLENVCNHNMINCSNGKNLKEDCTKDICDQTNTKNKCSHTCINKYSSLVCDCPYGMKLDDDKLTCKKINLCLETPKICDQECTSTSDGYNCSCYEGYTKVGQSCELKNPESEAYLLYSSFDEIDAVPLLKENATISKNLLSISDKLLTFDIMIKDKELEIYSSHVNKEDVLSRNLLKDWKTTFKTNNFHLTNKMDFKHFVWPTSFYSLAVDPVRDLVFWTDTKFSTISVFNTSSLDKINLNITDCYYPIALVIDPIGTKLFWIDLGNANKIGPRILMANMDGSGSRELVKSGLYKPVALTLDIANQRLYWSSIFPGSIKYLDLKAFFNGEINITTLFETFDYLPSSLALYKNRIYWSDLHQSRLYSVDKISGKGIKSVREQVRYQIIRIVSSTDNKELITQGNAKEYASSCSGIQNPCQYSCLPTSVKSGALCFGSPRPKRVSSFSWWFMIIPIVLMAFAGIAIMKYRNFKSRNQRNLTHSSKTVLVYDHVRFWDDGREETINDSEVVNVSDSLPILQTV